MTFITLLKLPIMCQHYCKVKYSLESRANCGRKEQSGSDCGWRGSMQSGMKARASNGGVAVTLKRHRETWKNSRHPEPKEPPPTREAVLFSFFFPTFVFLHNLCESLLTFILRLRQVKHPVFVRLFTSL